MGQEDEKIRIDATPVISIGADEALRIFARLIGRPMAREQFERKQRYGAQAPLSCRNKQIANSLTAP